MAKRVSILGSTGSIGENTLDLIRRGEPNQYKVVSLTANRNAARLAHQAIEYGADFAAIADPACYNELKTHLVGHDVEIGVGEAGLIEAASRQADFVMAAIIGAAGLEPTLAAVRQGTHIGLANKECLVCAGELFIAEVKKHGAVLLPVDSEHNAIFQVLETDTPKSVRRLILTASGGPFLNTPVAHMESMTAKDALQHPVWEMGDKISIDSATMMNKGLELIEAHFLFERSSAEIDIVVHPQSIVHSMVEYIDGSVLAQMGSPDMRTPIAYALAWPARMEAPVDRLDLTKTGDLSFLAPDLNKFPCLALARKALETGAMAPNILNASNEIAVDAFLNDRIGYSDIARIVEEVLSRNNIAGNCRDLSAVKACDEMARNTAKDVINHL